MVCPKCGSPNTSAQIVTTGSVGTSHTTFKGKKHHGLFYWITIGWIIGLFKLFLLPFRLLLLPFRLLFGKRNKLGTADTISATKTINKTMFVCQNCGYSWKA